MDGDEEYDDESGEPVDPSLRDRIEAADQSVEMEDEPLEPDWAAAGMGSSELEDALFSRVADDEFVQKTFFSGQTYSTRRAQEMLAGQGRRKGIVPVQQ